MAEIGTRIMGSLDLSLSLSQKHGGGEGTTTLRACKYMRCT
jgi:hypothetical protein